MKPKPLSKREQARRDKIVAVCKDVIKQVGADRYQAKCGSYMLADELRTAHRKLKPNDTNAEVSLQKLLLAAPRAKCSVCAIGGVFLSHVRLHNKFSVNYWDANSVGNIEMRGALADTFGHVLLSQMEVAFERGYSVTLRNEFGLDIRADGSPLNADNCEAVFADALSSTFAKFGRRYKSPSNRLVAIMRNIIKHNGEFNPAWHPPVKKATKKAVRA